MFLLIDGSSLLTTNFMGNLPPEIKFCKDDDKYDRYADKILHTSNGIYTNGVYSTLMDIMNIIRIHRPEYMAVAFDKTRDTFRRKLYPEYKAQRKPKPECLQQQFTTLKTILNELGIMVLESGDYEADDLIGSVASHFENPFMKIKFLQRIMIIFSSKQIILMSGLCRLLLILLNECASSITSEKLKNGSM